MNAVTRKVLTSVTAAGIALAVISIPAFADKPKCSNKSGDSIVEFAVGASEELYDFDDEG